MIKYKTYCKNIPTKFPEVTDCMCNKPRGGLWGCRNDEWKDWCITEQFHLEGLEKVFYWRLKKGSKVYRIKTKKDFVNLVNKYGNTRYDSIDFISMKQDYDAIEVVGNIVYKLRYGGIDTGHRFIDMMGLNVWDIPSICVLNLEKVKRL